MEKFFKRAAGFMLLWGLLAAMTIAGCESEVNEQEEVGKAIVRVKLVDAPGDFEHVFVEVQDIRVNTADSEESWESLGRVERQIYDLLKLTNGEEALLAASELPVGELKEIRLILGSSNYVVIDDVNHNLKIPSGADSGLKLKMDMELEEGIVYEIILDFDAARSVHQTGNGKYILKPVIRAALEAQSGSIKGYVLPQGQQYAVYAIEGTDSLSTYTDQTGAFLFRGLEAGTYEVQVVVPGETDRRVKVEDVEVEIGEKTEIDTLNTEF